MVGAHMYWIFLPCFSNLRCNHIFGFVEQRQLKRDEKLLNRSFHNRCIHLIHIHTFYHRSIAFIGFVIWQLNLIFELPLSAHWSRPSRSVNIDNETFIAISNGFYCSRIIFEHLTSGRDRIIWLKISLNTRIQQLCNGI